jgi:voltage-gated potassium channel
MSADPDTLRERQELVERLEEWLEIPLVILGFVWLALLLQELVWGLTPHLETAVLVIWAAFLAEFFLRFAIAPAKLAFLRANWLTAISLLLPALRVLRAIRILSVFRALRLARVITGLNRGMRSLGSVMSRRGFGYVAFLTAMVTLVGAAGMYAFERTEGLPTYGAALWWTAMIMTTMGSEYWPKTPEGRLLCFLLAVYALAVFGYLTAAIATFFIDRDAEDPRAEIAGTKDVGELRAEIAALRDQLRRLNAE